MRQYTEIMISDHQKAYAFEEESLLLLKTDGKHFSKEEARELLGRLGFRILMEVGKISDMVEISCLSETEEIRALELIDYVSGQFGIAKGTAKWAGGSISEALFSVCMSEHETYRMTDYFLKRIQDYFTECEVIRAESFAEENPDRIKELKEYVKARVAWAYVKSTDIVPAGVKISVRTLENDTGVVIEANDDIYVMVGCLGEVYQIHKEKFECSYEPGEEKLDIFESMLDFIPAVERVDDGTYIPIDEMAHLCYPRKGAAILAVELQRRTRVFSKNGKDYFLGNPGDYMAVRKDDLQDIYIIQKEVFARTYEEKS